VGVTGIGFGDAGLIGQATIRQLTHEFLIGEDSIDLGRVWHKM